MSCHGGRPLREAAIYRSIKRARGILSVSIADNIRLGRADASAMEVRRAAELAGAAEFIEQLPLGYNSLVGERGTTLSGGERQRLLLARAILVDPPILILDEPTNHLDAASTEAVRNLIDQRKHENQTTIIISHDELPAQRTVPIGTLPYAVAN